MARPIDYSVWDNIEISDDEDDTHPNIDTPSLFRWRHQARVERMETSEKEKEVFKKDVTSHQQQLTEIKQKLKEAEEKKAVEDLSKLKIQLSELEKQEEDFRKKEDELREKEKNTPWNVDTICHDGKSKTIINKKVSRKDENLTEDEKWDRQAKFQKDHKAEMKKFGMMKRYEDSQVYLCDNPHLACEETANFLVIWCIDLEIEEKHELMNHVAHQTIVMQFILELAKQLDTDPRACVRAFFSRIKLAEKQYMDAFNDELNSFKLRVKERAKARIAKAMEEYEEEEKAKRLGPGGLDPAEVFETLPKELQECFESKDIPMLQKAISQLPEEEAKYHLKRCVDSGLWVPGGGEEGEGDGGAEAARETTEYAGEGTSVDPPEK